MSNIENVDLPVDAAWSDQRILKNLGGRLRQERLNQNLTQATLADRTGLQRRTISNIENGEDFTMGSLLRLLRGLNQLRNLDAFLPAPGVSPIQLAQNSGRVRQRASRTPSTREPNPDRGAPGDPHGDADEWTWGDDG